MLYREGAALYDDHPEDATARFRALLAIDLSDDEPSTATRNRELASAKRAKTSSSTSSRDMPFLRTDRAYEIQRAVGINADYYSSSQRATFWAPARFSQARMAALAWLHRLAQADGKSQELADELRKAAEAEDATPRAMWDWVYLESVRGGNQQELLATARRLAQSGELAGQYLYLSQLVNRNSQVIQAMRRGGDPKDTLSPLSGDEIELAAECFKSVERAFSAGSSQNMNYMRVYFGQVIIAEFKRADRPDQAAELYERTLADAKSAVDLAAAMQLAISQSDFSNVIEAFDRFAKRALQEQGQSTKSSSIQGARQTVAQLLGSAMMQKDVEQQDALKLLDRFLDFQVAMSTLLRKDPRNANRTRRTGRNNYVQIPTGTGSYRNVQINYPTPSQYFDDGDIVFARSAFEWFKQKDVLSDLVAHLQSRVETAAPSDKIYAALAVAYVNAWNDDTPAALKALLEAVELEPQDANLRLDLAQLCLQTQQLEEALVQLNEITAADQNILRERELLALEVAVRLNDLERAREAAQRLFGLRLDANTQIDLAGKMRRLGMRSEAEAVMARAQRHAGSSLATLAALLGQYISEGRSEVASEVAHQILRRSRTLSSAQAAMGQNTADSTYRAAALRALAQSGELKEIIARVEEQLERSPNSIQLAETLAEYYAASGDTDKSLELQGKIVELHPADADMRFRYAQELAGRGKHDQACEQYKLAIKKKPALLQNRSYDVVRAFQQAKREVELANFIGELDLKGLNNPYGIIDMVRNMIQNRDRRAAGMALLRKAWEAFPSQRSQLMQTFYSDDLWQLPEVFELGRQVMLPTDEAIRQSPWSGVDTIMSYSQDGHVNTVLEKVLSKAVGNKQLEKLRDDVAAHVKEHEDWPGGKMLLALIDRRLKRPVDMRAAVKPLLEAPVTDYRTVFARWIVGQEIEPEAELRDLAIQLFQGALDSQQANNQQFQYSPGPMLAKAYVANDQREKARDLLVEAARTSPSTTTIPATPRTCGCRTCNRLASNWRDAEFSVDALRVYRELLTDNSIDPSLISRYGSSMSEFRQNAQAQMNGIIAKLSGEAGAAAVIELLAPREDAAEDEGAIDLLVSATPVENELPKVDSLVVRFVESAKLGDEAMQNLRDKLGTLAEARPRDFSVAVAQGLLTVGSAKAEETTAVLDRVTKLLDEVPLEELPRGSGPTLASETRPSASGPVATGSRVSCQCRTS